MDVALSLPSVGPDPIGPDDALAAVLGYARGRRPLHFRAPNAREGRWVRVPAFAFDRFDRQPPETSARMTDRDVLLAESLHGRLDPAGWTVVRTALDAALPVAEEAALRAAGRAFWELPDDEVSVLAEPGTVGAAVRTLAAGPHAPYVLAALHHRRPELFPLLDGITRRQLWPHTAEGDSGVHAVVLRELRANAAAFALLEARAGAALGHRVTRLRLHDVLLWLAGSLRTETALALGRALDVEEADLRSPAAAGAR
ncbi:DUF6308 family protein [Trujillonella endophytica]|uniref:Uncharacterized protein n=1 Tax=Trujillonella endophytica TaxID=673521 RepID=A0A1H8WP36_9ACTN|nr:DUF6308 family protein [Trujillella endophytica]SEP28838.1 hypothetical protein SAMN05660991_04557 [Trujillella endophytica]